MKTLAQPLLVLFVGAGILGGFTTIASANSQYSARRSNSVKLIWRRSMGTHIYTATQGARYSKHLGIRYSNNDVTSNAIWYTDAHEKLYDKHKHTSAIYYHVKTADGNLDGWIWRGYLKPASRPTSNGSANSGTSTAPSKPNTSATNTKIKDLDWENTGNKDHISSADMKLMSLFPNSVYDSKVRLAANGYLSIHDAPNVGYYQGYTEKAKEHFKSLLSVSGVNTDNFEYVHFHANNTENLASMEAALKSAGYGPEKRAQYTNWRIGGGLIPMDSEHEGLLPGEGIMILVKP